ncbi:GNAT family N-acetyltransferase [Fodinicola feengrottensis]|uniref:N-acetyltransferase domain-containing protein n=1 Tax=Fodinicola feengrottensis TaxID=435914 RepID=A0ABP4T0B5_9ACTN|nr:GNAT family N-acetyltransferase [Fodinicola feengrottensis]
MRVQVQRCTEEQLPEAAKLAADLWARARLDEPLLPVSHEDPMLVREYLRDQGEIWVATRGAEVVAVLAATLGTYGAYSPQLGVAGDPDALPELYAQAAVEWVAKGELTHAVHIPLVARELIEPFLRLSFGYQSEVGVHALKTLPLAPEVPDLTVSLADMDDFEDVVRLVHALPEHLAESPVFMRRPDKYYGSLRGVHAGNFRAAKGQYFLARVAGQAAGLVVVHGDDLEPLEPLGCRYLNIGVVFPEYRGTGVGLALTRAALADAVERRATSMSSDWRTTNLRAARFWPAVGFRPTCVRLSRSIDLTPR